MLVPAEFVPLALLLGIALGYAIRTEKTNLVYEDNRRLRRALRRRSLGGRHFAQLPRPVRVPRPRPPRQRLDLLPMLGPVAPFPDPPRPRFDRVVDHTRPNGTPSPLTSVAYAYDRYRRRVFVATAARVDRTVETAELAAVTA